MKLRKVEIQGFKTIAQKTVLDFPAAITCIAGPNGCGKSNVVDAIKWALGEQAPKAIRASAMGDVIFSGTQDVPEQSMASVALYFENDGRFYPGRFEGVNGFSVARKLFRDGESIYTLNNLKCRLKDISDIFLDTGLDRQGYAIIDQDRVKDIILSKPEDIRHLIEEVAGLGHLRVKRADTIKQHELTLAGLQHTKDILAELARQKDSLKSQASKARKYQVLKDRMNELTKLVWAIEIKEVRKKHEELVSHLAVIEDEIMKAKISSEEENRLFEDQIRKLNEIKINIDSINAGLNNARARHDLCIAERDASIERMKDIQASLLHLASKIEAAEMEAAALDTQIRKAEEERERLNNKEAGVDSDLKAASEYSDALSAKLAGISADYDKKRSELFEKLGSERLIDQRINYLNQRFNEISSGVKSRQDDINNLNSEIGILCERIEKHDAVINGIDAGIATCNEKMLMVSSNRDRLINNIEETRNILAGKEKELAGLKAKTEMLTVIANSSPHATLDKNDKSHKRLADVIKVKKGFEDAAGSLGEMLDYLIIKDLDELFEPGVNIAAAPGYIPLEPDMGDDSVEKRPLPESVLGHLRNYISPAKGYEAVVNIISKGKCIVNDIRTAVNLWKNLERSHNYITINGITLETSGILRVNAERDKYAGMLKARAELEIQNLISAELEIEIEKIKESIEFDLEKLHNVKTEILLLSENISSLEEEKSAAASLRRAESLKKEIAEKRCKDFLKDIKSWEEMTTSVKAEIEAAKKEKEDFEQLLERLKSELKILETKKTDAVEVLDKAINERRLITEKLTVIKVEKASFDEKIKGLKASAVRVKSELETDKASICELRQKEAGITSMLKNAEEVVINTIADIKAKEIELEKIIPEYSKLSQETEEINKHALAINAFISSQEERRNMILLESKEQEIAERMISERYSGRFGEGPLPEVPQDFDPSSARVEAAKLQTRVDMLGQINFASIESYDETQTRYDEMHTRYQELVLESERLKELVSSIEHESQKEFKTTFAKVRENFQEIFSSMFGGGQADIILQEGGMDAGVDIYACPPFKKLKMMSLLSEGEKTLTAISFIFALFKVRPSPFCILDEVDAPLDDSNINSFNNLIRSFADDSQFIVVTHNKNTMEMTDIIYGVTFNKPGVTKIISMDLRNI
ncbi:MAG TPA: chromosome segregation protein SMC [Desulfomonilia bacterium]